MLVDVPQFIFLSHSGLLDTYFIGLFAKIPFKKVTYSFEEFLKKSTIRNIDYVFCDLVDFDFQERSLELQNIKNRVSENKVFYYFDIEPLISGSSFIDYSKDIIFNKSLNLNEIKSAMKYEFESDSLEKAKPRLLLIDDDDFYAQIITELLFGENIEFYHASSVEKSLEMVREFRPHVVIIDLYLPKCNGLDLVKRFRCNPSMHDTTIALLSIEDNPKVIEKAYLAGVDVYLAKKADFTELFNVIRFQISKTTRARRLKEEILISSNEIGNLKKALDEHSIVSITDINGNIIEVNEKFCSISGYSREELIGKNHKFLKSGKHDKDFFKELWETITSGKAWKGVLCNKKKDGTLYYLESTIKPNFDTSGNIVQYISIKTDISELIEQKNELVKSENRYTHSQRFANIGTWDWNIVTGELHWSEKIASLVGYKADNLEASYDNFLAIVHPSDKVLVKKSVQDCIERDIVYNIEHRVVWPNGSVHWLHGSGDVIRDKNGKPLHMLGVIRDITREKTIREELEKSKDQADKANLAKSEFLSSMSHELRTPMNAILGFSQLLEMNLENHLSEDEREYTEEILNAGKYLLTLIDGVLDLARVESGNVELFFESVLLKPIIEECLSMVQAVVATKNIFIEVIGVKWQEITVYGDRVRLKQVLLNLLSNAVKYNCENGKILIKLSIDKKTKVCHILVEDTGIGMDSFQLSKLFQPFERLGAERTEVGGTGIGLVISKQLVKLMGDELKVRSEKGKGSSFYFSIPTVNINEFSDKELERRLKTSVLNQLSDLYSKTILYVEDNTSNIKLLERFFTNYSNLKLLTALDGKTGLEMIHKNDIDFIIIDINLGAMSGFELLRKIKSIKKHVKTPAIALSANAMKVDIEKGLSFGFDEYLSKPINFEKLATFLINMLKEVK